MATESPQPYRVLARKYRPQSFADLIGQEAMVRTLANAIRRDRLAHGHVQVVHPRGVDGYRVGQPRQHQQRYHEAHLVEPPGAGADRHGTSRVSGLEGTPVGAGHGKYPKPAARVVGAPGAAGTSSSRR